MNQQEDRFNSLSNNSAHIGNHCGVIGSQSRTVCEICDQNHQRPEQSNTLMESDSPAVHSKKYVR